MKTAIIVILSIVVLVLIFCAILLVKELKERENFEGNIKSLEQEYNEKVKAVKSIDQNIQIEKGVYDDIISKIDLAKEQYNDSQTELQVIQGKLELVYIEQEKATKIANENKEQVEFAQNLVQEALDSVRENYENQLENLMKSYDEKEENYRQELEDLRDKRNKAVLAAIQDYEKDNQDSFYKLQLTEDSLADIKVLRQIQPILKNKEILGKLIYKTYYEKPFTDLVGRVLNKEEFSGIYKITNTLNQKCYVGQAVNIKKRWQQHIKRAVGAEPLVNNKLYPAMIEDGVENFNFEVIDKCDKDKLNEREQYWQDFYQAKSFGYSIK